MLNITHLVAAIPFNNIIDEESVAIEEVKALGEAVQEVELSIQGSDVDAAFNGDSAQKYGARDSPAPNRSLLM